mmetsp:Transcript_17249/g.24372  ORF Transcript_17249/g.24372 Transcript_17249/m.24372 type:complete len:243 (-) Transcript_17249:987-1715(-)
MIFMAPRAHNQLAVRFTSITLFQSFASISSTDFTGILIPALLNSRSILPKWFSILLNIESTWNSFDTSVEITSVLRFKPASLAADLHNISVSFNGSTLLPANIIPMEQGLLLLSTPFPVTPPHPPFARRTATARPIPEPPPVTKATVAVAFWKKFIFVSIVPEVKLSVNPGSKSVLKSSIYSRINVSTSGVGGAPRSNALFESIMVGNPPMTLLKKSLTSYLIFPSFPLEFLSTIEYIASAS